MKETRQLILVIDDNEIDREAVARLMRDHYDIAEAATGREGLALFEQCNPICVLLDYRLPDFDGIDLLPKLRRRDTAVVMLTGQGNESVAVKALKAGARDYIVKDSLTRETLRLAVGTAIEKQVLQNKLERYRLAMESMPLGVMVLRRAGQGLECVATNSAACKALGLAQETMVGAPMTKVLAETVGAGVEPACMQVLADGRLRRLPEWRRALPGAANEIWDVIVAPLSEAELILTLDNITERVAAEQKQASTERQLEAAQRMEAVGRLAGGVAHDFNNFLTVILGYADVARLRNPQPPMVKEALDEIHRAAGRASDVTRQLLAFSRRQVISPRILDLNAVVTDMSKMIRRLIGEDIDLLTVPGAGLWKINADPSQVEQVVMNLAVNARDAMPGGGKITLETSNVELGEEYCRGRAETLPGFYVQLAMTDTGFGMDAATQARIFEPFFTTKEQGKGTGLGLATVYGIVKQNQGHIAAYSEPGKGTTFRAYWPRAVGEAIEPAAPQARGELPRGIETILLVEDEEQVRKLTTSVLALCGYTVVEARDGVDALGKAASHSGPISLLVTDVVMPRLGGRELAAQLTALRPRVRVLYMSGYTADAIIHQGVLEKGLNFIAKPYLPQDLARKVRAILDEQHGTGKV